MLSLKQVSNTEKPDEPAQNKLEETAELAELAELEDLDDLDGPDALFVRPPRLKEYLQSPDSPSRYLMILSILFGFLASSCFGLLIFQYWKHRHHEQKTLTPVIETLKIEPTYHGELGQFKVDWDDAEMRADLVAECSTQEACDELKDRSTAVQDLVLPLLQESSRSRILNPVQKQYLRQKIAEKLNDLKLHGRVIQIDFSDLTVDPRKN